MVETWRKRFCAHGAEELSKPARVSLDQCVEAIVAHLWTLAADPWDEDSLEGLEAEVAKIKNVLEVEARQ